MRNLPTVTGKLMEKQSLDDFIILLTKWKPDGLSVIFGYVWAGLDALKSNIISEIDFNGKEAQIERDLTENLTDQIVELLRLQDIPFFVKHSSNEMKSVKSKKAKPREYDFVFYWRARSYIKFPFEAKLLRVKSNKIDLNDYVETINTRFITGVYSPYSSHSAMVGYLIDGENILTILEDISEKLDSIMTEYSDFKDRHHKVSIHLRSEGVTKEFFCHHMIYNLLSN